MTQQLKATKMQKQKEKSETCEENDLRALQVHKEEMLIEKEMQA